MNGHSETNAFSKAVWIQAALETCAQEEEGNGYHGSAKKLRSLHLTLELDALNRLYDILQRGFSEQRANAEGLPLAGDLTPEQRERFEALCKEHGYIVRRLEYYGNPYVSPETCEALFWFQHGIAARNRRAALPEDGAREALEAAFLACGRAGANADTNHPMRAIWLSLRAEMTALSVEA